MHDPMQNHARGNIIFGDARLMAIIDLTQGCTPNHCYFTESSFRETFNGTWKIIISASCIYFYYSRKINHDERFDEISKWYIFASSDNSGSPCLSQSEIEAEKKITLIRE